jgi:hypothetical protein
MIAVVRRSEPALVGALVVLAATGCGGRAATLPRGTQTRARLIPAGTASARSCLRRLHRPLGSPMRRGVERDAERSGSLTFHAGRLVLACDRLRADGRWCAAAVGLLRGGRLVDGRLSLTCRDARGHRVGFAWIEPVRGARTIAIAQGDRVEVYPVLDRLPVRVATTEVALDAALFRVAQYTADGRQLERRRFVVHVSG